MSDERQRLVRLLASADRTDREEAAYLLGHSGDASVVPELLAAAARAEHDEDAHLLYALCEALGALRDPAAFDVLARLAATPMMAAVRALGMLGDSRATEVLLPLLANPRYALTAGTALGRLGNPGLELGTVVRCAKWKGMLQPDAGGELLAFDGTGWDDLEPPEAGLRVSFFRAPEGRAGRIRRAPA